MKVQKRILAALVFGALVVSLAGCTSDSDTSKQATSQAVTSQAQQAEAKKTDSQTVSISIYVPKEDASGIVLKQVDMDAKEAQEPLAWLQAAVEADQAKEYPVFKKEMKIKGVSLRDGKAIVDVNDAFVTSKRGDLTTDLQMAIIVDTLIKNDPSIQSVSFKHDGKDVALIGNYDLSKPLTFMDSVITQ